jgi:hypothetical protein
VAFVDASQGTHARLARSKNERDCVSISKNKHDKPRYDESNGLVARRRYARRETQN